MEWSDSGVEGANRFIRRLWRQVYEHVLKKPEVELATDDLSSEQQAIRRKAYSTLQKVTDDMSRRLTYNTAIAANMELINDLSKFHENSPVAQAIRHEALRLIVLMLSPIMPHVCEILWQQLVSLEKHKEAIKPVMDMPWPEVDESALEQSNLQMMIQINGKLRGKVDVPLDADDDTIKELALENDNVKTFLEDKTIRKVIVVKGRLINIVAN